MSEFMQLDAGVLYCGDVLEELRQLPDGSVQMCVTSPAYWGLRDYGVEGQLGLEKTPEEYVSNLVEVLREVRRVLRGDGTLWLNIGDSYNGSGGDHKQHHKNDAGFGQGKSFKGCQARNVGAGIDAGRLKSKDLVGIPWTLAFALRADGWYLRQDIVWAKPNPMPESVQDRCTKSHEYIFLLSRSAKYYYDHEAIKEPFADKRKGNPGGGGHYAKEAFAHTGPNAQGGLQKGVWNIDGTKTGKNKRSVWFIANQAYKGAHFAAFPLDLIQPCILAGCPEGGTVLDPFMGSGTTAVVAESLNRRWVGIDLKEEYCEMAVTRVLLAREEKK